jgi:hypothetical protein
VLFAGVPEGYADLRAWVTAQGQAKADEDYGLLGDQFIASIKDEALVAVPGAGVAGDYSFGEFGPEGPGSHPRPNNAVGDGPPVCSSDDPGARAFFSLLEEVTDTTPLKASDESSHEEKRHAPDPESGAPRVDSHGPAPGPLHVAASRLRSLDNLR